MQIEPAVLFEMTGLFDEKKAMERFNRAGGVFILGLRDLGGEVALIPELAQRWAGVCKLPPGGFARLLQVMDTIGWITKVKKRVFVDNMLGHQTYIILTPKGSLKAAWFEQFLKPQTDESE